MSKLFEQFSSRENLKKAYAYIKNELANSSLSVNPINHPAMTAVKDLGDQFFVALEKYLRDGKYKPERGFFVYVPKDNLGLRPVYVLSMVDHIVYQALFNQDILGFKIDGQLSDKVCFSNRVNDDEESEWYLNNYFNGFDDYLTQQVRAFDRGFVWKLEVDVQQYYEHIPVGRLITKLKDDFGVKDDDLLSLLKTQLSVWAEYEELPKGIPQGPNVSAVLGNVYLSSLDSYAEKELVGKEVRYFRYADDIVLMGKSKQALLNAIEKIVHFLREDNLTLNEKTKLQKLESAEPIEARRFFSEYEETSFEVPRDYFSQVKARVPGIISSILGEEHVERKEISELKYFLKNGMGQNFLETESNLGVIIGLIGILPIKPSLTILIIQYVSEGRMLLSMFSESPESAFIDNALWDIYRSRETSQWSKFWILKLLVSNRHSAVKIGGEVTRILNSKDGTIFKIVCLYYQAIHGKDIRMAQVEHAANNCKSAVEKSLYSFFLLNAFKDARTAVVQNRIAALLNSSSHELNLIGCYLYKNKPKVHIGAVEDSFSSYILNLPTNKAPARQNRVFMLREEHLIPIDSPPDILGVSRPKRTKQTVELIFPEIVKWEKVLLKIKSGLQDMEVLYDGKHIKTVDYRELGFYTGKKEEAPDRQWLFLTTLAALVTLKPQEATPKTFMSSLAKQTNRSMKVGNVHQIKRTLVKRLREIFKTGDDPFAQNRKYYEPIFRILPESVLRQTELRRQSGKLKENFLPGETDTDEYPDE